MQEGYFGAACASTGFLVDESHPFGFQFGQGFFDIGHAEGNMLDSFAALFQETTWAPWSVTVAVAPLGAHRRTAGSPWKRQFSWVGMDHSSQRKAALCQQGFQRGKQVMRVG